MKRVIAFSTALYFICISVCAVDAATINATNCSKEAVESAISTAIPGDIVVIPSGTCVWDAAVQINKSLTIKGQTITVRDDATYTVTATDRTIIQKFGFAITATSNVRITGITFDSDLANRTCTPHSGNCNDFVISLPNLTTGFTGFRIDHNHFRNTDQIVTKGNGIGYQNFVFDHNLITQPIYESLYIGGKGNASWSDGGSCGAANPERMSFIEDNEFRLATANVVNPIDSGGGARVVVRNNLFSGTATYMWTSNIVETHGHCWLQRDGNDNAAAYCMEISGNKVTNPSNPGNVGQNLFKSRGGRSYVYDNTLYNTGWRVSNIIYWIQEVSYNCNATPCAVVGHGHDVPLSDDPHYTGGFCTMYPCVMQPNNSYSWNNVNNGGAFTTGLQGADATYMALNRDYWNDISGTFTRDTNAHRLENHTTCTAQECYWETDTKRLYRCTDTDTWTLVYEAYAYPHPLTKPYSPSNLVIGQPP